MEYPELKRAVWQYAEHFKASTILIEDKSSGAQLIQELIREGLHAVTRYEPKMDKIMRLHSVTSTIENGYIHLPEKAEWLGEYLHEMTSFPKGKFDDQCDSTSQALDWIKTGCPYDGFLKWLENAAGKANGSSGAAPRETCPAGKSKAISHIGQQKRCLDCGKQWGQSNRSSPFPTRASFFSGRFSV